MESSNKIEQNKIDETFNNLTDNFIKIFIKILNEALAEKDAKIKVWQDRVFAFSSKYNTCYICLSIKDWIPETLTCLKCKEIN